jgi:hypothetical protein
MTLTLGDVRGVLEPIRPPRRYHVAAIVLWRLDEQMNAEAGAYLVEECRKYLIPEPVCVTRDVWRPVIKALRTIQRERRRAAVTRAAVVRKKVETPQRPRLLKRMDRAARQEYDRRLQAWKKAQQKA